MLSLRSWITWGSLLLLCSCGEQKSTTIQHNRDRPKVPTASVQSHQRRPEQLVALDTPEASQQYGQVLQHPWVQQQKGLTHVTRIMVDDIQSLIKGHEELNTYRVKAGLPTTTLDEESETLIATIEEIQAALAPLHLRFPPDRYSVLNIPTAPRGLYHTPLPFDIYKRIEFGETDTGVPYFLDVRVFNLEQLQTKTAREAMIRAIINWHINLLQSGEKAFTAYESGDGLVLIGHGNRNRDHFDGGHGFATDDRGVYLAFFSDGKRLYVLHADAPWKNIGPQRNDFLEVLNRLVVPLTQPIDTFKFNL